MSDHSKDTANSSDDGKPQRPAIEEAGHPLQPTLSTPSRPASPLKAVVQDYEYNRRASSMDVLPAFTQDDPVAVKNDSSIRDSGRVRLLTPQCSEKAADKPHPSESAALVSSEQDPDLTTGDSSSSLGIPVQSTISHRSIKHKHSLSTLASSDSSKISSTSETQDQDQDQEDTAMAQQPHSLLIPDTDLEPTESIPPGITSGAANFQGESYSRGTSRGHHQRNHTSNIDDPPSDFVHVEGYRVNIRRKSVFKSLPRDQKLDIRASQRTFEGAYVRSALGQLSFALVILKIFSREFLPIGTVFTVQGLVILVIGLYRSSTTAKKLLNPYMYASFVWTQVGGEYQAIGSDDPNHSDHNTTVQHDDEDEQNLLPSEEIREVTAEIENSGHLEELDDLPKITYFDTSGPTVILVSSWSIVTYIALLILLSKLD